MIELIVVMSIITMLILIVVEARRNKIREELIQSDKEIELIIKNEKFDNIDFYRFDFWGERLDITFKDGSTLVIRPIEQKDVIVIEKTKDKFTNERGINPGGKGVLK